MSIAGNQQQTFLRLLEELSPQLHRDVALPTRIQALLAKHREFGARDRRLYRELIFTTLRYLPWIEPDLEADPARAAKVAAWLAAETKDTAAYRAATCGDWPALTTLAERATFLKADAPALLPAWFKPECPAAFESPELDAQLARAPLWLRLQTTTPAAVAAELEAQGWRWRESPVLRSAWQLLDEGDVTRTTAYTQGAIEIQDLGSQLVLETIGIEPGARWLDACAGAGGKTLQLAGLLGPQGHIDAFDIRPDALTELAARVARASQYLTQSAAPFAAENPAPSAVANQPMAEIRVLREPPSAVSAATARGPQPPPELYDGVLVDAPCSGTGTWRRSPHLKWTTSPKIVSNRAALQSTLLDRYAACVRPGGRLVYATCSLARRENEAVVQEFLSAHRDFAVQPFAQTFGFTPSDIGLTIYPARHDTDGFFVASLRRR